MYRSFNTITSWKPKMWKDFSEQIRKMGSLIIKTPSLFIEDNVAHDGVKFWISICLIFLVMYFWSRPFACIDYTIKDCCYYLWVLALPGWSFQEIERELGSSETRLDWRDLKERLWTTYRTPRPPILREKGMNNIVIACYTLSDMLVIWN